jgi:hypothetical protein
MGWHWGILAASGAGAAGAYDLLTNTVLGSNASSVTFSSLNTYSDYKHLQLRLVGRQSSTGTGTGSLLVNFNGVTTSSYARHYLRGNGSVTASSASTSQTRIELNNSFPANGNTANIFGAVVIDILDFSSTAKNKTIRALNGSTATSNFIYLQSGLFNSTNAITSIELTPESTGFLAGSRFSLYGIKG